MTHTHNCMRCGGSFFCLSPATCKAGQSVMPRIVVPGPEGTPQIFEHVCASTVAPGPKPVPRSPGDQEFG